MVLFKKGVKEPDVMPVRLDVTWGDPGGRRARLAARSGDAATLLSLVEAATDPHEREFLLYAALHGITRAPWIEQLPDEQPDRQAAWLVRGTHSLHWAWSARGGVYGDPAAVEAGSPWIERLEAAEKDLIHATRLAEDPVAWSQLVATGCGLGLSFKDVCDRFDEADSRAPWLVFAHLHMLAATSPAWGGSTETMFAFVGDVAERAPADAPCLGIVPLAHAEVWRSAKATDPTVSLERIFGSAETAAAISRLARRSVEAPSFDDGRGGVIARNAFALALLEGGEPDRARAQFVKIGDRVSEAPWAMLAPDAGLAFARARSRVALADQEW